MQTVTIYPVRINRWRNHWLNWPRQKQILGSVLLWASRADAVRIDFDPDHDDGFVYKTENGEAVSTEVGPAPAEAIEWFHDFLHEIASDTSWLGWKQPTDLIELPTSIEISVPDVERKKTWRWLMQVDVDTVTFTSL